MGNRICGADSSVIAWETFEESGGPQGLKVDPTRPFRVDYMGSTPDYPENTDQYDLVLVGKDYQFHIFRATYTDVPEESGNVVEPADHS